MKTLALATALIVVIACSNKPEPTATPQATPQAAFVTPMPTVVPEGGLPAAVQILSPEYQQAYRLWPSGPWARRVYAEHFDDFDRDLFEQASNIPPISGAQEQYQFDAGEEFNLTRVLQDEDAKQWVEAKVADLAPAYKDEFANADTAEDRLKVVKAMVSTGDVRGETIMAELFVRWESMIVGMTETEVDHEVAVFRQMLEGMQAGWNLSERDTIILRNEKRVCELIMWDIVQVGDTLGVVSEDGCGLAKVVALANGALLEGKKPPTEDEYRKRFADLR